MESPVLDLIGQYVANKYANRPDDQKREMAFAAARIMLPLQMRPIFEAASRLIHD
jgi:hypothetical protein